MSQAAKDPAERLAAARAGSPEALGEALEACRHYLLLIADRELDPDLRAKGGASDLVQETFLEAHRDFARFQGKSEAELLAWLRQLLLYNLSNFTRRYRATAKRDVAREVALEAGSSSAPKGEELIAGTSSPSGQALEQERAEALARALERLPEDYRLVVTLHHKEQRSFEEIADQMQRTVAAVRKLWQRAIERLQKELEISP
jgi:RNA polymerase sigma-70 factor (ECF subfamily)